MSILNVIAGGASLLGSFMGDRTTNNTTQQTNTNAQQVSQDTLGQKQASAVQRLDKKTLRQLRKLTRQGLGTSEEALGTIMSRLSELGTPSEFDQDQYVSDVMTKATNESASNVEALTNQIRSSVGGSLGGNSAAALLVSKLQNDANAELAGVRGQAIRDAATTQSNLDSQAGETTAQLTSTALSGVNQLLSGLMTAKEQSGTKAKEIRRNRTKTVQRQGVQQDSTKNEGGGLGGLFNGISNIFSASFQ